VFAAVTAWDAAAVRSIIIIAVWTSGRSGSAIIAGSVTRRVIGTRGGGTDRGSTDGGRLHLCLPPRPGVHAIKAAAVNTTTIDTAAVDTAAETSPICRRIG
jgi:hypothetical protein